MMLELARKAVRALWYQQIGIAQADKPFRLKNETLQILTLLGVGGVAIFEWKVMMAVVGIFIIINLGFMWFGYVCVKKGIVKFEQGINNEQNGLLLELKKDIEEIKKKLDE